MIAVTAAAATTAENTYGFRAFPGFLPGGPLVDLSAVSSSGSRRTRYVTPSGIVAVSPS